jgi:deoxyribonuclease (pyrimidine dimer)
MRINIIPPIELMDQHLMAEIREIKMLPKSLVRSLKSKNGVNWDNLPKEYTMGKGHGKFFYNKLHFIENRFYDLLNEAKKRGFNLSDKTKSLYDKNYDYTEVIKSVMQCNFTPTPAALEVNRKRIKQRISERPEFYRYYGELNYE